ncbi:Leucine-rich repeat-containing protein 56 [Geodia barretti]|uniref:Leucine-rich repeat-containing protein 56 n=1 Tax=Geodia barretti TaxID=519541 RepID=A0AA35QY35_GEOBA|nr:Leucine-rich repeat-containing protein 56 [Geodia barretti]
MSTSLHNMNERTVGQESRSAVSLRRAASASPLHSASVQVTDVSSLANPAPVGGRTKENFGEDYLSPTRLRQLSGKRDLGQVNYLQISVNTQTSSLGNFGGSVPSLEELRCVESVVPCLRDLGTRLGRLKVLWLPRCELRDLDGLPSLTCLQELYISHNEVRDVSLAAMLPDLRVLDVESNHLSEEDQLGFLGLCTQLSSLTLTGNPLALILSSQQVGYRTAVLKAIPQLRLLDDIPVGVVTPPTPTSDLSSQSVWRPEQLVPGRTDPKSVPARPRTAVSSGELGSVSPLPDDSSDLTHGMEEVMCGNPVRALKARRRRSLSSQSSVTLVAPGWTSPTNTLAEDVSVTMATSIVDLSHHLTLSLTPSPPPSSLPTPPFSRPHSAATDLRHRRYRRPSPSHTRAGQQSLEMGTPLPPPHALSPSPSHSSSHTPHNLFTHNE